MFFTFPEYTPFGNYFLHKHLYRIAYNVYSSDNMKYSSIRIKLDTKNELTKVGSKNQSYDDIIRMLLLEHDESITFDDVK